jgi:hypothetical protein
VDRVAVESSFVAVNHGVMAVYSHRFVVMRIENTSTFLLITPFRSTALYNYTIAFTTILALWAFC